MKTAKRVIAYFLCFILCLSTFPAVCVFADGEAQIGASKAETPAEPPTAVISDGTTKTERKTDKAYENKKLANATQYPSNINELPGVPNLQYSFSGIDGETVSTSAENARAKMIVFFMPSCLNCKNVLSSLAATEYPGLDIVAADVTNASCDKVEEYIDSFGADNITAAYSTDNTINGAMWSYLRLIGISGSVTTPVCVFIDSDDVIQAISTGALSADGIGSVLESELGVEIDDGNTQRAKISCSPENLTLSLLGNAVGEVKYSIEGLDGTSYSIRVSYSPVISLEFSGFNSILVTGKTIGKTFFEIKLSDYVTGELLDSAVCYVEVIQGEPQEQTYSDVWSYDSNYHWHASLYGGSSQVADKAVHDWDDGVITVPADTDKTGVKTYSCSVCGYSRPEIIPALSPSGGEEADISYCLIEQNTGCYHRLKATGWYGNWAGVSTVSQFTDEKGNFAFAVADEGQSVTVYKTNNEAITDKVVIPGTDTCGTVVCDKNGYLYVVWGRANESNDTSVNTIFVSKYMPDGTLVATVGGTGEEGVEYYYGSSFYTKYPFDAGNCDAAINGNVLLVNYAREMYSGHQSNGIFAVNIETMEKVTGIKSYNSHSFDQRVTAYKDGFLLESQGDCFPRSYSTTVTGSNRSIRTLNTFNFWVEEGTYSDYDMYRLNRTYSRLGNILGTSKGAALIAASARSLSEAAKSEPYDLFVQVFDPYASELNASAFITEGTRTGYAGNDGDTYVTDYGVKWLTGLAGTGRTVKEVQAVSVNEDVIAILYELYQNGSFDSTWYMLISGDGSVLKGAEPLGSVRLNTSEDPVYAQGAVRWLSNRNGSDTLYLYSLYISLDGEVYSGCSTNLKESFVDRLYQICLGRAPSASDKAGGVWQLENGMTGVQIANVFVFSDEFKLKNYCDRHYVTALYEAFMGRKPKDSEVDYWVLRLQQGDSRETVFNSFALSTEFGGICDMAGITQGSGIAVTGKGTKPGGYCSVEGCRAHEPVATFATRLYTVCLDREPAQNEIDAWHFNLVHGEYTAKSASEYFLFCQEFRNHNYDDAEFVRHLYLAMMGRDPQQDEVDFWVWRLGTDATRSDIFEEFAVTPEFTLICFQFGVVQE